MFQAQPASALEAEIQALLSHFRSADLAADALMKKYEEQKLSLTEFECLATFFLYCGFYASLTDFIVKKLKDGSRIPWGHFLEALFLSSKCIPAEISEALFQGAHEDKGLPHLSKSLFLDESRPELIQERLAYRKSLIHRANQRREDLIREVEILRSQRLHQEEEKVIETLLCIYPEDPELLLLKSDLRKRLADEFFSRRPKNAETKIAIPLFESWTPEEESELKKIESSMTGALAENPSLAYDFALAQLVWENHDAALRFLEMASDSPEKDWLKAEALFRGRRFVELLEELVQLEHKYTHDTETIFAVSYLRAQALWGLQQKYQAIEILEGLVETRPGYRAAMTLLKDWKEDLS